MKPWVPYLLGSTLLLSQGCGGASSAYSTSSYRPSMHNVPLARPLWKPLFAPPSSSSNRSHKNDRDTQPAQDVRQISVTQADNVMDRRDDESDFGGVDLGRILKKAAPQLGWSSSNSLSDLVSLAKDAGAFHTRGRPTPGDIVLFHNQRDANGNGQLDDWNTGCGVVVKRRSSAFQVITRTGNGPRRVMVSPKGPSVHRLGNKVVNSFVRIPRRYDPAQTEYLAGQLYAGYIDIEKLESAAAGR